jgi:hypothetical protein
MTDSRLPADLATALPADEERTVRVALRNWPRTVRLCLIYLARGAPAVGTYVAWWLVIRR